MMALIERLRTKPLPTRRRIAFAASGVCTTLIAAVWLTTIIALNTLKQAEAPIAGAQPAETAPSRSNLLGAAAESQKAPAAGTAASDESGLTIVKTRSTSTLAPDASEKTIIPF